jgi:hypothetical protein
MLACISVVCARVCGVGGVCVCTCYVYTVWALRVCVCVCVCGVYTKITAAHARDKPSVFFLYLILELCFFSLYNFVPFVSSHHNENLSFVYPTNLL